MSKSLPHHLFSFAIWIKITDPLGQIVYFSYSEVHNRWLAYTIPIWSETGHSAYPKKQITPNIHTHTMPPNTQVPGSSHQYTHGYCSENQAVCHVRFAYLEEHGYTAHTPPRYIVLNCARSCGYPDVFDKST